MTYRIASSSAFPLLRGFSSSSFYKSSCSLFHVRRPRCTLFTGPPPVGGVWGIGATHPLSSYTGLSGNPFSAAAFHANTAIRKFGGGSLFSFFTSSKEGEREKAQEMKNGKANLHLTFFEQSNNETKVCSFKAKQRLFTVALDNEIQMEAACGG
eukprot:GHVT01077931.1.p1 GENE.GHVT01077931.1~~GHVT01077931.1.p1  ORF type:complete len:154 (-),score=25.12 GHVT01077931.1:781-1242(-)